MKIAQGAESVCVQCDEPIYLDIREGGGIPDWGSDITIDGEFVGLDFGCIKSPDTSEEGTGSHVPKKIG